MRTYTLDNCSEALTAWENTWKFGPDKEPSDRVPMGAFDLTEIDYYDEDEIVC